MERASHLIRGLKLPKDTISPQELVCAAWPGAVGKIVAAHTRAASLVRARLVIEVEDNTWRRQLNGLSRAILRNLEKHLGPGLVEELEFRVVPRRKEPQRAHRAMPLLETQDEAAGIADPVLRGIYRAARKKALA